MKTYRLFFVSVYRFIWNTFLYDISSILLIIIFKLATPFRHSDDRIAFSFSETFPLPAPILCTRVISKGIPDEIAQFTYLNYGYS